MSRPASKAWLAALSKSAERHRNTKMTTTTGCGPCPFGQGSAGPVYCIAATVADGQPLRAIPPVHLQDDRRPPRWCPLRKADHLVTLRNP